MCRSQTDANRSSSADCNAIYRAMFYPISSLYIKVMGGVAMVKQGRCLDKIIAYLGYGGAAVGVVSILIVMSMIFLSVMLRYFFKVRLLFTTEYSGYLFAVVVYMGLAYAMRVEAHVNVDLISRRLPRRIRESLEVAYPLLALGLMSIYLYYAWGLFRESVEMRLLAPTVTETPLWIPYMFLWLGLTLFCLELIARATKKFIAFQRGSKRGTGEDLSARPVANEPER